jgi:hypothetical protein
MAQINSSQRANNNRPRFRQLVNDLEFLKKKEQMKLVRQHTARASNTGWEAWKSIERATPKVKIEK